MAPQVPDTFYTEEKLEVPIHTDTPLPQFDILLPQFVQEIPVQETPVDFFDEPDEFPAFQIHTNAAEDDVNLPPPAPQPTEISWLYDNEEDYDEYYEGYTPEWEIQPPFPAEDEEGEDWAADTMIG